MSFKYLRIVMRLRGKFENWQFFFKVTLIEFFYSF